MFSWSTCFSVRVCDVYRSGKKDSEEENENEKSRDVGGRLVGGHTTPHRAPPYLSLLLSCHSFVFLSIYLLLLLPLFTWYLLPTVLLINTESVTHSHTHTRKCTHTHTHTEETVKRYVGSSSLSSSVFLCYSVPCFSFLYTFCCYSCCGSHSRGCGIWKTQKKTLCVYTPTYCVTRFTHTYTHIFRNKTISVTHTYTHTHRVTHTITQNRCCCWGWPPPNG